MISGTITDRSGRTLSGQTAEAFWISVRACPAASASASTAPSAPTCCTSTCRISRALADTFVIAHPNAGLPNAMGGYDLDRRDDGRRPRRRGRAKDS